MVCAELGDARQQDSLAAHREQFRYPKERKRPRNREREPNRPFQWKILPTAPFWIIAPRASLVPLDQITNLDKKIAARMEYRIPNQSHSKADDRSMSLQRFPG
jgi:hypothetical protein